MRSAAAYIEHRLEEGTLELEGLSRLALAFQIQNGLVSDGKPGPDTMAKVAELLEHFERLVEGPPAAPRPAPTPTPNPPVGEPTGLPDVQLPPTEWVHGIDLDHHQIIHDEPPPEAVGFAWVGATEGTRGRASVDPEMLGHIERLRTTTEALGVYHFARPSSAKLYGPHSGQPHGEAENFVRQWERAQQLLGKQLPPVLDIEDVKPQTPRGAELVDWCARWCERCEALTGRRPIIYTYFSYIHVQLKGCIPTLGNYHLWLADYRGRPPHRPREIPGWQWLVWQYTGEGRVDGITGHVDRNVFRGTQARLMSMVR